MTPQRTISGRAWAELMLLALIWGGSFFSIAIALREVPVFTSVAHRVFWAALVLWLVVLARGYPLPRDPRVWAAFFVMGLLNNVLPFSLMAWGQTHIESGLTSILNAATAIFGALVAALFLADERLTLRKVTGICLGFAGVVVAIGAEALADLDIRSLAQIAVIGGTISYAFASVWARLRLGGLRPEVAAAGMLSGSSLVMLPLATLVDGPPSLALAPGTWLAIGYYAVVATAGAYLLYYRVLAMAGAANLMLVTLLIPPTAILLGAAFLAERLSVSAFLGLLLIGAGLLVIDGRILRRTRRRQTG
ncbi:MAG: DMT family transporter [Pseudomonadota bacterium]